MFIIKIKPIWNQYILALNISEINFKPLIFGKGKDIWIVRKPKQDLKLSVQREYEYKELLLNRILKWLVKIIIIKI